MKKLLLTIFVSFLGLGVYAQHFSNLPEKERNKKLIKLAKKEFRAWADGRYKGYVKYGIPEVKRYEAKSDFFTGINKKNVGKLRYEVIFKYEKDDPREFEGLNGCEVHFSDELGIPIFMWVRNYYGDWGKYFI